MPTIEVVDTIAALKGVAAPVPPSVPTYLVRGYYTLGDSGGGLYRWDPLSSAADNGGTYITPNSNPATGRWKLLHQGLVYAAQFGALGSVSNNTPRLQALWDFLEAEGGVGALEPRVIYPCSGALDWRNAFINNREFAKIILGNGATLDFSSSGITSGNLLTVGATVIGNAPEITNSSIEDLIVKGPEDQEDIEPRTLNHAANAVAISTTVGIYVENGVALNLRNVVATHCHTGIKYHDVWGSRHENVKVRKCIIGHYYDDGCTHIVSVGPEAVHCTFGFLMKYTSGDALGTIWLQSPRTEDVTIGFHIDQGTSNIWAVRVTDPYMERVFSDHFRVGMVFDQNPANWSVRGANPGGKLLSLIVEGGVPVEGGDTPGWGANRKPLAFTSVRNVASARIEFACTYDDLQFPPYHLEFRSLVRMNDVATQRSQFTYPGYGIARCNSAGVNQYAKGNISGASRTSTGKYNVTFFAPYHSLDSMAPAITPFAPAGNVGASVTVDTSNTTVSNLRFEFRDPAGALVDRAFTIVMNGELLKL